MPIDFSLILLFFYLPLNVRALTLLNCHTVEYGARNVSVLVDDPAVACREDDHLILFTLSSIVLFTVDIAFPVVLFAMLAYVRALQEHSLVQTRALSLGTSEQINLANNKKTSRIRYATIIDMIDDIEDPEYIELIIKRLTHPYNVL